MFRSFTFCRESRRKLSNRATERAADSSREWTAILFYSDSLRQMNSGLPDNTDCTEWSMKNRVITLNSNDINGAQAKSKQTTKSWPTSMANSNDVSEHYVSTSMFGSFRDEDLKTKKKWNEYRFDTDEWWIIKKSDQWPLNQEETSITNISRIIEDSSNWIEFWSKAKLTSVRGCLIALLSKTSPSSDRRNTCKWNFNQLA